MAETYLPPIGGLTLGKLNLASASPTQVLAGYSFYSKSKQLQQGTMVERENTTISESTDNKTFYAGSTFTLPDGHYANTSIKTQDLESQTKGTAGASAILSGYTAWVNGSKITGNIPNVSDNYANSCALNCGGDFTYGGGYCSHAIKVSANSLESQTQGTAGASAILSGYTAWVNGSNITGNMTNHGAWNYGLDPGSSIIVPAGYHNGSGVVSVQFPSSSWPPHVNSYDRRDHLALDEYDFFPDNSGAGLYFVALAVWAYDINENSNMSFAIGNLSITLNEVSEHITQYGHYTSGLASWGDNPRGHVRLIGGFQCVIFSIKLSNQNYF